jgi:hypothetical protein
MNPDEEADRAVALIHAGQPAAGAEIMERLVAQSPDTDRYHYRLGLAYSRLGVRTAALRHMRRAVELHYAFGLFHHEYIRELAREGDAGFVAAAYHKLGGLKRLDRKMRRHAAATLLEAGASPSSIARHVPSVFGERCVDVADTDAFHGEGVVRITMAADGFRITLPTRVTARRIFVERLMAFAGYLDRLWAELGQRGGRAAGQSALLCLDDCPPDDGPALMCFSGCKPTHILIPDSAFLETDGYTHFHEMDAKSFMPFGDRVPTAHWRGALTGLAYSLAETLSLPRVQLASLKDPRIDAKITNYDQYRGLGPQLVEELARLDVLDAREPESENFKFQVMIDVDGNSNSWPGLYLRLLTGACVVKIMTRYRQWYYARLQPGVNVLAVNSVAEVPDKTTWALENPVEAERIGRAGRALAQSLTVDSEYPRFRDGWRRAAGSE